MIILLLTGLLIFPACEKEDKRIEEEKIKLQQYLDEKGYSSITPTSSGLYHVVINEGTGAGPAISDYVNLNFIASLVDGTVFETSDYNLAVFHNIDRDDKLYGPAKFQLENLGILGLREGLVLMKEMGISRLIIPSHLAFGSTDYGIIPPYSTVIYDIELLDVIKDPVEHEQNLLDAYIDDNEITVEPTTTGVYYIELVAGSGDLPSPDAEVTVHYKGSLLDGRVFDESSAASPLVFNMGSQNILPGFIEGVSKMRKGGKATVIVPWSEGYGAQGSAEGIIPPYSTLVFDLELADIR